MITTNDFLLLCSASRRMRQTLSKLGGTHKLIRFLFGHIKKVFLNVWWTFINLTNLDVFFGVTLLKIVAANFRKMEKMSLNEI